LETICLDSRGSSLAGLLFSS